MVTGQRGRRAWLALVFWAAECPALVCLVGCQSQRAGEIDITRVPTRDDITAIYCFYPRDLWMRDTDGKVVGFTASVYFHSGQTLKGAFVPGKILIWLHTVQRAADGTWERQFVHGWEMNEKDAMNWRVRHERRLGWQYGFPVLWPPDLDLAGKQVEIEFGYERLDDRLIPGTPRRFRVPVSLSYRTTTTRAAEPSTEPAPAGDAKPGHSGEPGAQTGPPR